MKKLLHFCLMHVFFIDQSIKPLKSVTLGVLESYAVMLAFLPTQADVHIKIAVFHCFETVWYLVQFQFSSFLSSFAQKKCFVSELCNMLICLTFEHYPCPSFIMQEVFIYWVSVFQRFLIQRFLCSVVNALDQPSTCSIDD